MKLVNTLFLILIFLQTIANKVDKGYRSLSKGDYEDAHSIFTEVLSDETNNIVALYGVAKTSSSDECACYDLNQAYTSIIKAEQLYEKHKANQKKDLDKAYINLLKIKQLKFQIDETMYNKALNKHTVEALNIFIDGYPSSSFKQEAIDIRDQLAYNEAEQKNTLQSYDQFLIEYPNSSYVEMAKSRRDAFAFERAKQKNDVQALEDYIKKYPSSDKIVEATELLQKKAYVQFLKSKEQLQAMQIKQKEQQLAYNRQEIEYEKSEKKLLYVIIVLFVGIVGVIGILFRQARKAGKKITAQKQIIETKNEEIVSSIQYAKRIQEAILPSSRLIKEYIPNSFVFYKPKDIVSGDFYWMEQCGDKILFAVVDCTGHGVPGAFMSMIGYNGLNRAINEYNYTKPADILNHLNLSINQTLQHTDHENIVKDGMDIALCSLDYDKKKLQYAGAFNPLYIIKKGALEVIKADKQPIGEYFGENSRAYTNHEFDLEEGDAFYIFSDGYADQFGGNKDKKFTYKRFRNLLLEIYQLPVLDQKKRLEDTFQEWKAKQEQIDDICIIGVQV